MSIELVTRFFLNIAIHVHDSVVNVLAGSGFSIIVGQHFRHLLT
jgi:hypothetical protein